MELMTMPDTNIDTAKNLLIWNSKNLTNGADLQKSELSQFFAPEFRVKANGIDVMGNYNNYFDFLNGFRSTINSISYKLDEFIIDKTHVVIPMIANIVRVNGESQTYTAILILGFDNTHRINLWQEVYIEVKA
jgi:hypothetical protein